MRLAGVGGKFPLVEIGKTGESVDDDDASTAHDNGGFSSMDGQIGSADI
jgi:hypothetical protein